MRKIKICGIFAALLSLFSCNDKIDVQQAYDFGITTWYLQKTIKPGQPVEIRFYLTREGIMPMRRSQSAMFRSKVTAWCMIPETHGL